jgi:hypothetical protein
MAESIATKLSEIQKHCKVTFAARNHSDIAQIKMEKLENKVYDYLSVLKGHVETMGGTFQFKIEFPDEGDCDTFDFLKPKKKP